MATRSTKPVSKPPVKKAAPASAAPKREETKDAGPGDLQALADTNLTQGYFGITDDPNPNEAYSLKSGPDSPSAASHTPAAKAKKETRHA